MSATPTAEYTTAHERRVLAEVLRAVRKVQHGSILVVIHDGQPVQIETTEKKRLER